MNDLISRAALLKECAECQKTDPNFEARGWANHFISSAGEPSTEWYCVEYMIENAPAVDAVPVEWLRQMAEENSHYAEPYFAFAYVLHEWQQTKSIEELQAESEMRDWKAEQELDT